VSRSAGFGELAVVLLVLALLASGQAAPRKPRARADARRLSGADLRTLARNAGFPDPRVAAAIAMAESTGDPRARNVTPREDSRGLWQINVKAHKRFADADLYDPQVNARAAFDVSRGGSTFRDWSTFTSGKYKEFLDAP
jgi:hypothetical protein